MLLNLLSKVSFKGKIDIIDYKGKIHSFGTSTPYVKIKFNNKLTERKNDTLHTHRQLTHRSNRRQGTHDG